MRQAIVKHAFSVYGVGDKLGNVDAAWLAKMVEAGVVEVVEEGQEEPPPVAAAEPQPDPEPTPEPPPVAIEVIDSEFQ